MIPVSDEYKEAIKKDTRSFDIKSILLMADQPIPSRIETTNRTNLGALTTMFNTTPFTYKYARLEEDYMTLDGSFILPNRSDNNYIEFLGDSTNCSLSMYFNSYHVSYSGKKMKILFDGGYATSFTISCYAINHLTQEETLVDEHTYTNDKEEVVVDIPTIGITATSKKIKITINNWNNNKLPKIKKIMDANNILFNNDDIINMKMLEQTDLRGLDIPGGTLSITLDNYNRQYNVLDPNNLLNKLNQNSVLITYLGLDINGAYEYMLAGGYRYSSYRENSDKTIDFNFEGQVIRDLTRKPILATTSYTPSEVAGGLFGDLSADRADYIAYQGNFPAQYMPYTSRQEQEQEALVFYNMSIRERRNSGANGVRLFNIADLNQNIESYTISLDNQIKNPEFNKSIKTQKIRFNYYNFGSIGKTEIYRGNISFEKTSVNFEYSGTCRIYTSVPIIIDYTHGFDVYYNDTKIIDNGSLDIHAGFDTGWGYSVQGYYYTEITLHPETADKTTGIFRIEAPTYEKLDNIIEIENPNVSSGALIELNSNTIKTETDINRIATTIFEYENLYPYEFTTEIMGDIRLEVGDKITLESLDGYHTAIIQSIDTTFDGGLTQIIKGVSTGVLQ